MSTNKKHIDQEVDKTMQALDGMERAKTDPFFYSRLSAKLEHRNEPQTEPESSLSFGFTFSVAAILLIFSLNIIAISQYQQGFTESESGQEEWMEEITYDYQVIDLSYYETFEEE